MQTWHLDQLKTQTRLPREAIALWLPSETTSLHDLPRPSAPRRKWQAVLPWLMEDRVLEPVERLHFCLCGESSDHLQVLAVSRSVIDDTLAFADKVGVEVDCIQPDYLALPWQPGQLVVAWRLSGEGRVLVVRSGEKTGFAAAEQLACRLLQQQMDRSPATLVALMPEEALPDLLQGMAVQCGEAPDWHGPLLPGINLLSGDYARQSGTPLPMRALATMAALVVFALTLLFTWLRIDIHTLEEAVAAQEQFNQQQFSRLFPGIRVDTAGVRATLEALQQERFLQREALDQPLAALLVQLDDVLDGCNCALQRVSLENGSGQLVVAGDAASLQGLEGLQGIRTSRSSGEEGQTVISLQRSAR